MASDLRVQRPRIHGFRSKTGLGFWRSHIPWFSVAEVISCTVSKIQTNEKGPGLGTGVYGA